MFKNATLIRIAAPWAPDLQELESAAAKFRFAQPGPTEQTAAGFVPPRTGGKDKADAQAPSSPVAQGDALPQGPMEEAVENAAPWDSAAAAAPAGAPDAGDAAQGSQEHESAHAMVESIGGELILSYRVDRRNVPGAAVKQRAEILAEEVVEQTGRKPGRKQMKELKEQALQELLPLAFIKTSVTRVWLCRQSNFILIDSTSSSKVDAIITALVKAFDGLSVRLVSTLQSPTACMSFWLTESQPPYNFSIDRSCELRSSDSTGGKVKYTNHSLDTEDIKVHMKQGKVVAKLAMTWRDRISLVLDDQARMTKLAMLDVVFESGSAQSPTSDAKGGADEAFDADVALFTGEMKNMVPDFLDALGGEDLGNDAARQPAAATVDAANPDGVEQASAATTPAPLDAHSFDPMAQVG